MEKGYRLQAAGYRKKFTQVKCLINKLRVCFKFAEANTYGVVAVGSTPEGSLKEASLAGASELHTGQGTAAHSG
ncbi:MAG: hypothetical protein WCO92_01865 [Verrucomicrobiota bacterium]